MTAYDAWGLLASIEHRGKTGTGTALGRIEKYLYAYDSHDRVTEETIQSAAGTSWSRYAYDSFGRMVRESTGQEQTTDNEIQYAYDRNDNRTQQKQNGVIEYSGFDAADRLLWTNTGSNAPPNASGWSWRQFAYDDFGQMVYRARGGLIPNAGPWKREVDLKWDSQGRLREARDRSAGNRQLLSATYTADGERITKSDPITGAHINSYGLHDTNRNTVYTPGVGFRAAGTDRFHHADRLGSTRALTDGAGRVDTVKSKARYSAFGQTQFQGPDGDHPTEHQFAGAWGYEREPSATGLGLDYLYQRYYDPAIGRFISADPIGLAGGMNLYGYCAGDPVNAVDPSGEIANFVVAGCSSMALGFVMTKLAGGEYTWKDAAWDFGAGAVGVGVSGKLSKALRLWKMKQNPSPKLFFRGGAWKPEYLKTGKIAWASSKSYSGAPRAIDGGAHRFRWPTLKQPWKILERKPATDVFEIPAEYASQYQPAFGLNPTSWWKGLLGQYTYQNPAATGKVAATQAWASSGSALGSFTVERAARHYLGLE